MNRDEAKFILRAYPPGGAEAEDPQFRDALEMLKQDPQLASWFAHENAIDTKLCEKFQAFPVPSELKGQLLAGRKVVVLRAWWQRPRVFGAVAATLAVLGVLAILLTRTPQQKQFVELRSHIANTVTQLDHLDLLTDDLVQIRQWLGSHSAPEDFVVPGELDGKPRLGCRVFKWSGQTISLVCFKLDNQKVAHLFVIDRSTLVNMPGGNAVQFQTTRDGIATASWSDARRVYIVAMRQGEQDLKHLFL